VVTVALVGVALLVWPSSRREIRRPGTREEARPAVFRALAGGGAGVAAPLVALTGGLMTMVRVPPATVLAAGIAVATGYVYAGGVRRARGRRRDLAEIRDAVRVLGRELQAGADPPRAAGQAASVARGAGVQVLRAVVAGQGDGGATSERRWLRWREFGAPRAGPTADVAAATAHLRSAWLLSERCGVALRPLVDGVAEALAGQDRIVSEREAQLAGPRLSGWVLAALPVLGLVLGAGMGADPLAVLFGTGAGGALLVAGTALTCTGLLWSARIARP
jgi:tight adherence protein B